MSNVIPRQPGMMFEQCERAIGMLTAGMSARDIARHFQCHKSTISRLLNRFQQTGKVTDLQLLDSSKLTEFADDNFKFYEDDNFEFDEMAENSPNG